MADERIIRIRLDGSSAMSDANKTNRAVKGIGSSADSASSSLFKMSFAAKAVGAALASAAIAKFFTDAAVAAKGFNQSISNLSAITGAVGDDLKFLRTAALEFGETTTLSASDAAGALKLVASAKPDLLANAQALKEVTAQAVLLAEASGGTLALEDAAKAVGKSLNQFGADASEAARFVNVLAAGSKFGSSEVLATSEALKEAGVSASGAKISFEETNSAIQVLAKSGIEGSQAGTALRNIFLKLETDTNQNLRPSLVGLSKALENVNALNETGAQKVKRFALENINAAQFLLKNISALDETTSKLTGTNTAFEQSTTNVNNLAGDLKSLGSAYEALAISVGSLADDEMRRLTQETTSLIRAINGNKEALAEWHGTFETAENIIVVLSSLIAGRFVASLGSASISMLAVAASSLKATVQTNAMGVVIARTTMLMNIQAVAARGLTGALALVGGPAGLAVAAGAALIYFASQAENAEEKTRRLKSEIESLTASYAALDLRARATEKNQLDSKIAEINAEIEAKQQQLKNSEDAVLAAARDGSTIRQSVIDKITAEEQALTKLNEQLQINTTRREALAKVDAGESIDKLFSGDSGSELFGGGTGESKTTFTAGGSDLGGVGAGGGSTDNQDDSAFQSTINKEKLVTQQLQEEIAARRALLNGEINQRQLDEELALQEVYYGYEARRAAILENETITAEQRTELLATLAEQELLAEQVKLDAINSATESSLQDRESMQEAYSQSVQALQMQTYSNATALLNSLNSESKAAALIGIGIQTATAFAANSAATASAATLAYASQLIPGDPTSIARASAAAAKATTLGNVNGALILASGAAKGFGALGGGGGGSPSTGGSSGTLAESPTPRAQNASETQSTRRVIDLRGFDNGGYLTKEQLTELLSGDDDVIIASNSGQQQGARVGLING